MRNIEIYTSQGCGYCSATKSMLKNMGLDFEEFDLTRDGAARHKLIERTGRRTVPQIFVDGESIGGYQELATLRAAGELP
jgi:GrxC family glutaredoxin